MRHTGTPLVVALFLASGCTVSQGGPTDAGVDTGPPDANDASTCDQDLCPGKRCSEVGECSYFTTCNDLHTARPTLETAVYHFNGPLGLYFAYCDMDTSHGGWTLAARSVASATETNFGWFKAAGDITDTFVPYSLNMANYTGSPTEALVGVYKAGKLWGAPVYKITLPANFPESFRSTSTAVTGSAIVVPACGTALPTGLGFAGFTSNASGFYFDATGAANGTFGLGYAGFSFGGGADCAANGEMDQKQGLIYVR